MTFVQSFAPQKNILRSVLFSTIILLMALIVGCGDFCQQANLVIPFVMAGHSRSNNGVASVRLCSGHPRP